MSMISSLAGRPTLFVCTKYHFTVVDNHFNRIALVKHDTVLANIEKESLEKYYKGSYETWYLSVRKKNLEMMERRKNDIEIMQDEINSIHALYALDPDRGKNGTS